MNEEQALELLYRASQEAQLKKQDHLALQKAYELLKDKIKQPAVS